jgi:hypothetical protein
MKPLWILTYTSGVAAGSAAGFCSPLWYLGFLPLSAGLLYAAYDLVEVTDADAPPAPQR